MNRSERRHHGSEMARKVELLKMIARDCGCTCGPIDCRPQVKDDGEIGIRIFHADSCLLDTEFYTPDGRVR